MASDFLPPPAHGTTRGPNRRPGLVDKVGEKVTAKLAEQAAKQRKSAERLEAQAKKAVRQGDTLDRVASTIDALDVWFRHEPAGRRPRLGRDDITAAAMRLADAEGFAAVSMRRIADELAVGTMTLYHYVRTKDELLTLVTDAIMGEVVVPAGIAIPTDWRDALMLIASRSRDVMRRHSWILDITDDPPIGPNSVRHFDQTLQAVAYLDATLADKLDIVTTVDEFVFGYCLHERNNLSGEDAQHAFGHDMVTYVTGLVASGSYPQLDRLAASIGLDALWDALSLHLRDESRFARNLRRILDGIAADLVEP